MSKLSRRDVFRVALLCVAIVGVPDYFLGFEYSLSLFYIWAVGIATWYGGRRMGLQIALISTLAALSADLVAGHLVSRPIVTTWNGFLHLGFMLVVAYLLDRLHSHVRTERALARSDPVTGIYNRRAFLEHLRYRLGLAAREAQAITLAYLDLDDFKRINDRHGHAEGDRILRLVAKTLTRAIRRTDIVARIGGDEFALILGSDQAGAEHLLTSVRQMLVAAAEAGPALITCSIGCVTFRAPPPGVDVAMGAADALMYKVKSQGKNAVAFLTLTY